MNILCSIKLSYDLLPLLNKTGRNWKEGIKNKADNMKFSKTKSLEYDHFIGYINIENPQSVYGRLG